MNQQELTEHGSNDSLTHVDFMIDAILEDGTVEPIFRAGNWAF